MKKSILALAIASTMLTACQSAILEDGYQIGDATKIVFEKKKAYCKADNAAAKAVALLAVRQIVPNWQPVCSVNILPIN